MAAWPKPLDGVDVSAPLPTGKNEDGKSLAALQPDTPSLMYERFPAPLNVDSGNAFECVTASSESSDPRGFHVMFRHTDEDETRHAHELHERIRREFPELRIYRVFEQPIGPHSTGMFGALASRSSFLIGRGEHVHAHADWRTLRLLDRLSRAAVRCVRARRVR